MDVISFTGANADLMGLIDQVVADRALVAIIPEYGEGVVLIPAE